MTLLALVGCDNSHRRQSPAAQPQVLAMGNGVIRGQVKFTGTVPVMKTIVNPPCHQSAVEIREETVVVSQNRLLRNVFIFLEGAGAADGSAQSPALLDQVDCRYTPHAIGLQTGQTLIVRSSDPTLHNVHFLADANTAKNFGMPTKGGQVSLTFARPEFIPVKCDVHPWMKAYVGVFENPFFAVTQEDGSFELKNLPEGNFKLVAWHERFGRLERAVTLDDGKQMETDFEYKAPAGNN